MKLTKTSFTTLDCGLALNPSNPENEIDYTFMEGSKFSTTNGKKVSFSMWAKFTYSATSNEAYFLYFYYGTRA